MKAFSLFRTSDTLSLFAAASPAVSSRSYNFRTQLSFPQRLVFCRAETDGSVSLVNVPPSLLLAEREEAKAVLHMFLTNQGMNRINAARKMKKLDLFVDHLMLRLHTVYKTRYLVGRELTTPEIRDALIPYLEELVEEHGDSFVEVLEYFPIPLVKEKSVETMQKPPSNVTETSTMPVSTVSEPTTSSKKPTTTTRASNIDDTPNLPPHIVYLEQLGMERDVIKEVIRKFPAFGYYSLEGKIKPVVEFLLDLGIAKSDIPVIISKRPQLCGISLSDNLIPTMAFLEDLGVDKKKWAKVIQRFPALLTYSRSKLQATVDYFYEMGLSSQDVGKVLTRYPSIISYSVEEKLRPTAEYFSSIGVNPAVLMSRCPQAFGLSIESSLKPVTEFFLQKGYHIADFALMASRYGALYTISVEDNLLPKWEYFLTMEYPKTELVKFPQYFGYSLEERIKPRHEIVRESGVRLLLNQVLSLSDEDFQKLVKRKVKKKNACA
ncbi:putative transcription regulator mTERF family [Helianthus annuus]|uniref:Transcription regulator mTERF family n=1 Tax=Helianthus annuus TaxID=4232 RepID=A0A9K3E4I1_HELAN|nr:transcription termination factor MTERF5, chloroplastic isoform X1 [Helianthus annuus]KAF5765921.1 putative transcription regulator mTERF family [Helianthus annuus]KAJ0457240.1 putative transcription regulator mTERF family [Helianthus annuus]KAJ0474284.1 putative transcription regulator mTERF family [Helianthus annuus]KAJ0649850.1 putative transcription regulator mTERF family [Helianthus annuus]KAJ0653634.1 putative transcription regulator mTERF family [Helianthus annuus]